MMEKHIAFTPDAVNDLSDIKDYISRILKNPAAGSRIVNGILDDIEKLSESPELGSSFVSRFGIPTCLRYLVVGKYIVVYRNEESEVRIIHVFYGRRDYLKLLLGEDQARGLTSPAGPASTV